MVDATILGDSTDIAIIGLSGRFPGARNVDEFWQNLRNGVESISLFSDEELLQSGVDPSVLGDPNYVKAGAILEDIDKFDAAFFGFTPKEAQIMDPQHRLFIETAWNAIESAGYNPETYKGSIGLYAGSGLSTYLLNNLYPNAEVMDSAGIMQVVLGNDKDSLTTRVAYLLNLTGPCFSVQTYCSTSLVAVSIACSSLLNGDCDMALAGGVLVSVPQKAGYYYQEGGIASPDARCRAFDARAKGSPLGNGVGVVILKRLEDAVADGDTIHAVIKGSAINNDGSLKAGYTAPGVRGQSGVIVEAQANAGVDAESIGYIEAHGTGTALGDAAELTALIKSFSESTDKKGFCAIGSAKTNVGHLDRAAGVTGLIKTALSLKHGMIPPSLNYEEPNPQINLQDSPFYVNTTLTEWKTNGNPRRAGVSAFGIGGTNAHVILEEAPALKFSPASRTHKLLLLSARTESALEMATTNLRTYLDQHAEANLADIAYTLQVGRKTFEHRRILVCRDREEALKALETLDATRVASSTQSMPERPVAFLFPGVGESYVGVTQQVYAQEPTFRETVDRCCRFLHLQFGLDLHAVLYPDEAHPSQANGSTGSAGSPGVDLRALLGRNGHRASSSSEQLKQTALAQPAAFVLEYALAQLLFTWGIRPQAMLGYSLGEYVAACLAGVFSLEDALTLVARRAQLIAQLPAGAMLAVGLSEQAIQPYLTEQICLAAISGPASCVLAGPVEAIEQLEKHLSEQEIAARRVETTHAFHSSMLEPLSASLQELVGTVELQAPQIPYISNVTGTWITAEQATDPAYWAEHMRQTVRFAQGVEHLLEKNEPVLVEVGPGQSLSALVKQHPACGQQRFSLVVPTLPSVYERQSEQACLLTALGKLWLAGVTPDWQGFYAQQRRQRVPLPTYPFERQRYWIDPPRLQTVEKSAPRVHKGKKPDMADWFYLPAWEQGPLSIDSSDDMRKLRSPYLVFLDSFGLGEQVVERLTQEGHTCISVQPGEQFTQRDEQHFTIGPQEPADYLALVDALRSAGLLPKAVLHLWSLSAPTETAAGADGFQAMQERGFYSLLFLAQALGAEARDEPIQVIVASNRVQQVTGQEDVWPEKATMLGACKVISQEYQDIQCRSVDLVMDEPAVSSQHAVLDHLLAECTVASTDPVVAYREASRWIQTYQPLRLEAPSAHTTALRQQGVYLITGGLGGVGLVLAEHLAQTVQARLVLLGRSGLPARQSWSQWLESHEATESTSRKIERIQALEALGAEVLVLQADVADQVQMERAINQAYERFGALHGVIHAAGIVVESAFRPIQSIGRAECEWHFQPKVYGTYALAQALGERELDFCVVFSSLSSVLGGLGFVGYAAANIFMDAFVSRRNKIGTTRWISVNWDTWQVGMDKEQGTALGGTVLEYAMDAQEGVEAFDRILAQKGIENIVNSTGDLQTRIRQWIMLDSLVNADDTEQRGDPVKSSSAGRSKLSTSEILSRGEYEQQISEIWQQVLGLPQVGLCDNFFDLGGNSLSALQVLAKLKKALHLQLPVVALFEAPTISALVSYLLPACLPAPQTQQHLLAQRRQQAQQASGQQDIAIIGMSGRFPGASCLSQFWHNLRSGVESITFFSDDELLAAGVDPALVADPHYVKARPILPDIDLFDAAFFGYSPREAALTDPQQRLFLECSWDALEQAGYDALRYQGLVGVFGGTNLSTYLLGLASQPGLLGEVDPYQLVIGNDKDALTTSVSYKLNLKGPSVSVQTFCSTSLVALHLAGQSLRLGECDLALAGGVSLRVPSLTGHLYQQGGMESPDGHCRTFDAQAQGGLFGDGVGVVVLKRLAEALADGDTIHAVVKGSAINNDGSLKVSYTAPSVSGQAEVVTAALAQAGVEAESISYIEAHGTATPLGDPIEVASLTKAFRQQTARQGYCALGSVKTNIGHLDRAAGISGLIKTVLALQHGELPPSLHFQRPNPAIDFAHSPFYVNTQLAPWKRSGTPRRAGVNSLGMGGTNAHVVLQEAPERQPSGPGRAWQLLLLSARTQSALGQMTANLAAHLQAQPELSLADVAYTLQVGRSVFAQRRLVVCRDREEAIGLLEQAEPAQQGFGRSEPRTQRPVAFLFPGLGEHYVGVAQEVYEQEPTFRETVDRCCALLSSRLGLDLHAVLFPQGQQLPIGNQYSSRNGHNGTSSGEGLDLRALLGRQGSRRAVAGVENQQTAVAQPALFVLEYALAQLLMQWGIRPQAMLGYSLGEYVAACLAGVLSLEDALMLVARRAQLIAQLPQGAMLAVALSEEAIRPYLTEQICLAAVTGPGTCVLAGPVEAIEQLEKHLSEQEIAARRVPTTHAFHSWMLEPLREPLSELVRGITLHAPQIPYISNVTGTWITAEQAADPAYWAEQMCQTVRFAQGVEHLLADREAVLVEVGPGHSLSALVKQHPACGQQRFSLIVPILPSEYERQSEQACLLTALGKLWLAGVAPDWQGFSAQQRRQRVPLPTYPFERQRYWIETQPRVSQSQTAPNTPEAALSSLRREDLSDWFYLPGWKNAVPFMPFATNNSVNSKECWLFLLDGCRVGTGMVERLVGEQQEVITVVAGEAFSKCGETAYTVHPTARADYERLLQELQTRGKLPQHIVHCWTVTPEAPVQHAPEVELNTMLAHGFYSLLALTQALGDVGLPACRLTVVSSNMQDVTGSEQLCPEKATVLGPCKVIPLEYPTISCRSIDICLPEAGTWQEEELIRQLVGELTSASEDTVVALRGSHRWVQTFEPVRLASQNAQAGRLRDRGVYLITGGLGGIGLAMAEHLARTVQARLVLTTRSGLPPRSEWPDLLRTHPDAKGVGHQIRRVLGLEELGAEVLVLPANAADEAQMRGVIQQAIATFGAIHGVLHAAGVPGIGLMQLKTPEMAASVLAPKVMGTLVLERVLQNLSLDFLILFSSITSTTGGGPGQVDYCAANAFLDVYARRHFWQHGTTIAIDWGEWKWNAWEEGLAGYDTEAQIFFKENRQRFGIAFEEGTEALTRVLSCRLPQVVVSTQDFRAIIELSKSFTAAAMLQKARQSHQARAIYPRPNLGSSYIAPKNETEREIAAIWEDLLGISQVGTNDNFFELGGNSLIGIDLITRLRKALAIETIPTFVLYEAPTVSAMAQYLEQSNTTASVEVRHERGEKRRESLKHRMREARGTR